MGKLSELSRSLDDFMQNNFQYSQDMAMEQALRYKLRGSNTRVTVLNNLATFEGDDFTEEELKQMIDDVLNLKL